MNNPNHRIWQDLETKRWRLSLGATQTTAIVKDFANEAEAKAHFDSLTILFENSQELDRAFEAGPPPVFKRMPT